MLMRLDVTRLKAIPIMEVANNSLGRLAIRVTLDSLRAETLSEINALPVELEQLVWLLLLNNSWGKYGLHTFLSGSGGDFAPQVLASLTEAGMGGRAEIFAQAMQVFGVPYPTEEEERKPYFGWRRPGCDNPLRSSDYELFRLSTAFGTEEEYQKEIETFICRTPELEAWVRAERPKLRKDDRLRWLTRALLDMPPRDREELNAWPRPYRILWLYEIFIREVMNGCVHQYFYNSAGDFAPEMVEALYDIGVVEEAEGLQSGIDMFDSPYPRDTQERREGYFHNHDWNAWDEKLSMLPIDEGIIAEAVLEFAELEGILPL
jgi:hypothetical protein